MKIQLLFGFSILILIFWWYITYEANDNKRQQCYKINGSYVNEICIPKYIKTP